MDNVITIISAITHSALGHDDQPASILKQCTDSYLKPLTHLINLSISLGIVPDELKVAKVMPIFKGEDEQLVQNYRPISEQPFFNNKIYEKIVATCDIDFLVDNMVFYKRQFGFRKNHPTSHTINTLVERVSKALDTGKYVVGAFYINNAFDTVDHNILFAKLKQ